VEVVVSVDRAGVAVVEAMSPAQQQIQQQEALVQATASQVVPCHSVLEVLVELLGEEA
jgi:hypothetical protein